MVASLVVRRGGSSAMVRPLIASLPLINPRQLHTFAELSVPRRTEAFRRVNGAFSAQSASGPFALSVASRSFSLSLWPSKAPENDSSTANAAQEVKERAQSGAETIKTESANALHQTEEAASNAVSSLQESANDALDKASETVSDLTSKTTGLSESLNAAGVQPGELTALGLNHLSSPVGWITNLLETVGLHTGLPWWGTIMLTTIIIRLCLAPITISGQKNAIRLGNIQPQMKIHMDDIKNYKAAGENLLMQKSVFEVQTLMKRSNAHPLKSITPILFQLPIMFSFYLALSRLAASHSETFAHGGPFWTMDLTLPDPTWFLPVISTAATLAVAEAGFLIGTTAQSDPSQTNMIKWIFRGSMPVIGYIATGLPSGVLVYWATTNIWSLLQFGVLQIPQVRKWVKFPKRIAPAHNPYAKKPQSFMQQLRERAAEKNASSVRPVPVVSSSSRQDALKSLMDDKASYNAASPNAAAAPKTAPKTKRLFEARARKERK